jgi:phenylalanyl-tRNA synthetase alpha chain
MWYYYLLEDSIKSRIKNNEAVGALSYGKVYRKDEIDRHHMNVFHQMDGWYLCPKDKKIITTEDLQNILVKIAQAVFGPEVQYRFNQDTFPYTNPSLEMEIKVDNHPVESPNGDHGAKWVEVLGSGVVSGSVLEKLGVDSSKYNGWAFGLGLERLAIISMELPDIRLLWSEDGRGKKQLVLGNKFKEVSKFPPITRDISFLVNKDFVPNNYFDLIRDLGGDLVEEVRLMDKYENTEKFGEDKISYMYRIVYRSNERTLKTEEIDPIQDKIYQETATQFKAEVR